MCVGFEAKIVWMHFLIGFVSDLKVARKYVCWRKLFIFFNKYIFASLSNHSQTQSNSTFKLYFFSKPTHIHISYHHFSSFHYQNTQNLSWNLHNQKNPEWNRQLANQWKKWVEGNHHKNLCRKKRTASSSVPLLSRCPRSASPSVPTHISPFRNAFQKSRYELLQGSKYSYGRQIMWNAFVHANFYFDVKKFIENMSWIGTTNLDKTML